MVPCDSTSINIRVVSSDLGKLFAQLAAITINVWVVSCNFENCFSSAAFDRFLQCELYFLCLCLFCITFNV